MSSSGESSTPEVYTASVSHVAAPPDLLDADGNGRTDLSEEEVRRVIELAEAQPPLTSGTFTTGTTVETTVTVTERTATATPFEVVSG